MTEKVLCINLATILYVYALQLATHDFLLGAIPGLEYLFRPSMAAASATGDGQDHFFYAQVQYMVIHLVVHLGWVDFDFQCSTPLHCQLDIA